MKYVLIALLGCFLYAESYAQQEYFVFIQQPQGQPFYVRMGEESHSSTASGHLILGALKDSVYDMYVGFPRSRFPEQLFRVTVQKKDLGFELRQQNGRWLLGDIVGDANIAAYVKEQDTAMVRKTDSYSELMAGVVDDSTVLYKRRDTTADKAVAMVDSSAREGDVGIQEQAPAPDTLATRRKGRGKGKNRQKAVQEINADSIGVNQGSTPVEDSAIVRPSTDTVALARAAVDSTAVRQDSVDTVNQPLRDPRDIIRLRTENIEEGRLMIYLDRTGAVVDTIRLIVPR